MFNLPGTPSDSYTSKQFYDLLNVLIIVLIGGLYSLFVFSMMCNYHRHPQPPQREDPSPVPDVVRNHVAVTAVADVV